MSITEHASGASASWRPRLGQPAILSLPSTSNVSMNGSFVNAPGTPSNSISVPGSALPGRGVSNFKVTSGVFGVSMASTNSLGRIAGFIETSLPFSLGTADPFSVPSKYCSPFGPISASLTPFHKASCGLSLANFSWFSASISCLVLILNPAGGIGWETASTRNSFKPASSGPWMALYCFTK